MHPEPQLYEVLDIKPEQKDVPMLQWAYSDLAA